MFRPEVEGEAATLGALVAAWIEQWVASPSGSAQTVLTREQQNFLLRWYKVDAETGRRRQYRRGVFSRAKGHGRSPFLGMVALAEAFAPVVPDGFDANGRPVGKPWATIRPPWVQLLAVSLDQTRNAWLPTLEGVRNGPLIDVPGVEALASRIVLPRGGRIEYVTASAVSREGNRCTWAALDQTESWLPGNGGTRLAAVTRRNLSKANGTSIESPNAYSPGQLSVSEDSANYAKLIAEGRARDDGLLYDHRAGPALTDDELADDGIALAALRTAYGDSSNRPCVIHEPPCEPQTWGVDLDRVLRERLDPSTTPEAWTQYHLNRPAAENAVVTEADIKRLPQPAERWRPTPTKAGRS